MNMPNVTATLQEHGITHKLIAPHVVRIHWLVDGSSQPVADFDLKYNFVRKMERFQQLGGREKGMLRTILDSCKFKNVK